MQLVVDIPKPCTIRTYHSRSVKPMQLATDPPFFGAIGMYHGRPIKLMQLVMVKPHPRASILGYI